MKIFQSVVKVRDNVKMIYRLLCRIQIKALAIFCELWLSWCTSMLVQVLWPGNGENRMKYLGVIVIQHLAKISHYLEIPGSRWPRSLEIIFVVLFRWAGVGRWCFGTSQLQRRCGANSGSNCGRRNKMDFIKFLKVKTYKLSKWIIRFIWERKHSFKIAAIQSRFTATENWGLKNLRSFSSEGRPIERMTFCQKDDISHSR